MTLATLAALAASVLALLIGAFALAQARQRGRDIDALHQRFDEELEQWRRVLNTVSQRADDAYDRASQPSMPGEAALRLQNAAEGLEDLRNDLRALQALVKRESEQRLATEISLFGALENVRKQPAAASTPAPSPAPPRRARRTESLFEIVDFGEDGSQGE